MSQSIWFYPILKYYYQASENSPKVYFRRGNMRVAGSAVDYYSQGKNLPDQGSIWNIVKRQIDLRRIPVDPNGIYFVLVRDWLFI